MYIIYIHVCVCVHTHIYDIVTLKNDMKISMDQLK